MRCACLIAIFEVMNEPHDYIAPRHSPFYIGLAKLLFPGYMRWARKVVEFVVVDDGLERLANFSGRRIIICPNHASEDDAEVIFGLSWLAKEDFYYLTAHEVFHGHRGWNIFLLPEVGCYSVTRGTPDPQAYRTTRQILVENKSKLVVFPEGEVSHFNEVVMPLEPGVTHISFSALHKLRQKGIDDDITVLPLAILYNYVENIQNVLERSAAQMEKHFAIDGNGSFPDRLTRLVLHVISGMEKERQIDSTGDLDFASRAFRLREKMIDDVAAQLGLARPDGVVQLEFAHTVKSTLCDRYFHQKKLEGKELADQKSLYKQIVTAIDLIALEKSCLFTVATTSGQDEIAEVVHWLERVLFGKNVVYGKRRIMMQLGEPISLGEFASQFEEDENAATVQVNKRIRLALLNMLTSLISRRSNPQRPAPPVVLD